jgi:acyl-[acyl-carrier-protein] desaturase
MNQVDVLASIESEVESKFGSLIPVNDSWQPSDFVPDLTKESWPQDLTEFRKAAQELPDELMVVLVGTMVTEEALPSYQTSFNRLGTICDATGDSPNPWAKWSRAWTAEENRHGDLLNRYLYLTGRVDMRSVEVTVQHLIRNGFNPDHSNDPYNGLVYTSFQERATRISHGKVSQLTRAAGEPALGKICNVISADEARHEDAYKSFMGRVFEIDPSGAMLAMEIMLTRTIKMPAHLMSDPEGDDVFACFSSVAQRLGVYTFVDYIGIMEHLIENWDVSHVKGLSGAAAEAQDRVCRLPAYYKRRSDWMEKKLPAQTALPFPWINKREVKVVG